jgi:hypothetical protein
MRAGIQESAQMPTGVRYGIGIGDAHAIETQRARFAGERGLQLSALEIDRRVQKSRST